MAGVARRSVLRLRDRVFAHVMGLPMAFFDRSISGQLLSRVTNDSDNVAQSLQQSISQLLTGVLTIFGTIGMMIWISWRFRP